MSYWVLERYIYIYLHVLDIYQTYPWCRGPAPWINTRREKKSFCQVPSRAAKVNCYKDNEGKPFCSLSAPVSLILNNSWSLVIVIDQEMKLAKANFMGDMDRVIIATRFHFQISFGYTLISKWLSNCFRRHGAQQTWQEVGRDYLGGKPLTWDLLLALVQTCR